VRIALTSGLTRKQVADDLGVGMSTLNKWITSHRNTDVVSKEDMGLAQENDRLRREVRILKEERGILKKPSRVGARLCAVETACATVAAGGQRPFAYWRSGIWRNPVKKRGPWVDANLRVVTPCLAIPIRKMTDLHSPRPSVASKRNDDGEKDSDKIDA